MSEPVFVPSGSPTRMAAFAAAASGRAGRDLTAYDDLHAWSVAEPDAFWSKTATTVRQPINPIIRATSSEPRRSSRARVCAVAPVVKKSTMMLSPRHWQIGRQPATTMAIANSMISVSPITGLPNSQRPTMLQLVSMVITTTTSPATMAHARASQSNTFSTVGSLAVGLRRVADGRRSIGQRS